MRKNTIKKIILGILGLAVSFLLLVFILLPLFGSFASVSVPASCTDSVSHVSSLPNYFIRSVGDGKRFVENSDTAVVVLANYGQSPFYTQVYVVNRHTNEVANQFTFPTNVIDAGFDDDTLYLFNDKLGHFVSAVNGKSINDVITSDNYRGLYQPNRVQSDLTISGVTASHSFIFRHHIHMVNIVRGCYLP